MPSLTEEDKKVLLVETHIECKTCHTKKWKNYCRECDEFFLICKCPRVEHVGHRTY